MELIVPTRSLEDQLLEKMATDLDPEQQPIEKEVDWKKYIDPDPVRWIQTHFYIPETHGPMQLHESQIIPLREGLAKDPGSNPLYPDEHEFFRYSTVVWGSIKKSAKSSLSAAVCLWMMWQGEWRSAKIIANKLKQSQSRNFYYAKRAILLHPEWREICRVSLTKIELPNHSVIEALPMNPEGEAGGNDDFIAYTEIWAWKSEKAQQMWTETTLSPTKYGKSLKWLDTYAGRTGESVVLERLYQEAVKPENCINPEYEMYTVPASRLFVLWNTRPRLSFQTKEYYAQEETSLTPSEFRRVHKNEWVSSEDAFVPPEWWARCQATIPPLGKKEPVVLALDAGVTNDTFGMVAVSGFGENEYAVRFARRWVPPSKGRIDFAEIQKEVERFCDEYNVIELTLDEYQLAQMAEYFENEQIVSVHRFPQVKQRAIADKRLQDAIRNRTIHHDGNEHLKEHVQNANSKADGENKLRIVKRSDQLKIDLCVCTSMALDRAVSWGL